MKINPDSPDFQSQAVSTGRIAKGDKTFSTSLGAEGAPLSTSINPQPLASIAKNLSGADLLDQTKANAAVHQAVNEIMDREFPGLQGPDRERVASWMRSDPVIRETLLKQITALVA